MSLFSKPALPALSSFLQQESERLETMFGPEFRIQDHERYAEYACSLTTSEIEVEFSYDWRDRWVSASLRPLNTEQPIPDLHGTWEWRRFLGLAEPKRRKSERDRQQIADCLIEIEPILELFRDQQALRNSYWFIRGYSQAYNDWASRNGSWTEA